MKTIETSENTLKCINLKTFENYGGNFENTLKHIIETYGEFWKPLKHYLKTIMGEFWKHFETHFENTFKCIIWKSLKSMGNFENTLKHIIWKPLKPMGDFKNTFKHMKTFENIIWKHFMGNFENTLKHITWKPLKPMRMKTLWIILKPMGNFETLWNTQLKTIKTYGDFWKHFDTHNWKPLKPMENTFKHIIWKPLKQIYENTLKTNTSFENLGNLNSGNTLKHTMEIFLKTLWNTMGNFDFETLLSTSFENTLKHILKTYT